MLASLLGALIGAASFVPDLADYQPSLSPLSFDPAPKGESFVAVDSVRSGNAWVEVEDSRIVQTVSSTDAAGRPTAVKVATSLGGIADTSERTQSWINGQVLETLNTSFAYGSVPVSLSLSSSTSGSTVSQALAINLFSKANVAARDTLVLNAAGRPSSLVLWSLDTTGMAMNLLSGSPLTLLPALRSFTSYASDTLPKARAIQAWISNAWKVVDSSRVELVGGVPRLLVHTDTTGTTRDSLVWSNGRLVERIRAGEVTSFEYDGSGRVLRRLTSRTAGDVRTPVSSTTWNYDVASGIARSSHASLLSVTSSGQSRTALLRLERSALVRVSVHSVDGRLLGLLADGQLPAGISSFSLNGIRGAAIVKVTGSGISATASLPSP